MSWEVRAKQRVSTQVVAKMVKAATKSEISHEREGQQDASAAAEGTRAGGRH